MYVDVVHLELRKLYIRMESLSLMKYQIDLGWSSVAVYGISSKNRFNPINQFINVTLLCIRRYMLQIKDDYTHCACLLRMWRYDFELFRFKPYMWPLSHFDDMLNSPRCGLQWSVYHILSQFRIYIFSQPDGPWFSQKKGCMMKYCTWLIILLVPNVPIALPPIGPEISHASFNAG